MAKKTKIVHRGVIEFSARLTAAKGETLADDPEVQELIDWLSTPLENQDVGPNETLTGVVTVTAVVDKAQA